VAVIDDEKPVRWVPIPRDRDQAFVRFDGLLLTVARGTAPQLVKFGPRYSGMLGLTWNGRDLDRLTGLLLQAATVEVVGATIEVVRIDPQAGTEAPRSRVFHGMMYGTERLAEGDTRGGIEARYKQGALPSSPRADVRIHRGEPVLLLWYAHADGEAVRAINRIACDGDRIAGVRNYFYTPDCIAEICSELGVPFRINGYLHCLSGL